MQELMLTLIVMGLVFPLGWVYGKALSRKDLDVDTVFQKGARGWVFLIVFLIIALGLGLTLKFPRILPPHIMVLLEPLSWIAVKAVIVFMVGLAMPLSTQKPRAYAPSLVAMALIMVGGVHWTHHYFLRPIPQKRIKVRMAKDGSILQSTGVTCSAASFANAMRFFGVPTTEKEAAKILGTRDTGTTDVQMLHGLQAYGMYGHYVSVLPRHLVRMNRPAFISIDLKVITHSILYFGHDSEGNLFVIDPINGKGKYTPEKFKKKLYINEGIVITDKPLPQIHAESPAFLIRKLQKLLQAEGLLNKITAQYDAAMIQAIKDFQTQYKIPATGKIDDQTYLLLTGPQEKNWPFDALGPGAVTAFLAPETKAQS